MALVPAHKSPQKTAFCKRLGRSAESAVISVIREKRYEVVIVQHRERECNRIQPYNAGIGLGNRLYGTDGRVGQQMLGFETPLNFTGVTAVFLVRSRLVV